MVIKKILAVCALIFLMQTVSPVMAANTSYVLLISPPKKSSLLRAMPMLAEYLAKNVKGIKGVKPIPSRSYDETGEKFVWGQANAMYGGSFLSYVLIKRDLAMVVARGVTQDGDSTYHSNLITRKDTPYNGLESVVGKRVTYVTNSASGEIFARAFFKGREPATVEGTVYVPTKNHKMSLKHVQSGKADFAFVKNLTWDKEKSKFPDLHTVAHDTGESPLNVFVVSKDLYEVHGETIERALLGMADDPDPLAKKILQTLKISKFIPTRYPDDYKHSEALAKAAGIDPLTHKFGK